MTSGTPRVKPGVQCLLMLSPLGQLPSSISAEKRTAWGRYGCSTRAKGVLPPGGPRRPYAPTITTSAACCTLETAYLSRTTMIVDFEWVSKFATEDFTDDP